MGTNSFNHPQFPFQNKPRTYYGDTIPTSGPFEVGDIFINTAVAVGEATSLMCASASPLVWTPLTLVGEGPSNLLALTAAGAATGTPGWITASGFAGVVTLQPASAYGIGFNLYVQDLTTHAVTLAVSTGSIIGPTTALASTLAAAHLISDGTNWRRVT